jgi:hypothetical protein
MILANTRIRVPTCTFELPYPNTLSAFSSAKNHKQRPEKKTPRENNLIVDVFYQNATSLPVFLSLERWING